MKNKSSEGKGIKEIDWNKLQELYKLCRDCAVSFSLVYEEGSNEFHTEISSSAKNENFISKTRSFETSIKMAKDWLEVFNHPTHH